MAPIASGGGRQRWPGIRCFANTCLVFADLAWLLIAQDLSRLLLLVVAPETQDFHDALLFQHLVDEAVLDGDAAGAAPAQLSD